MNRDLFRLVFVGFSLVMNYDLCSRKGQIMENGMYFSLARA